MQQTKRSLLGLLISLIAHGIVIGFILWNWNEPSDSANSAQGDISTSISMELLQGMVLEEPAPEPEDVQKEPEPEPENVQKEPEPEKQEIVEDPTIKPEPKKIKEPEKEKPNGSLSGAKVTKSSGDESLDKAALDAINVSRSVGTRPAGFPSSLSVQISFTLQ